MPKLKKETTFMIILAGMIAVFFELSSYGMLTYYEWRREFRFQWNEEVAGEYASFIAKDRTTSNGWTYDPVTGWRSPGNKTSRIDNCLGDPITYHFDQFGARVARNVDDAGPTDPSGVRIMLVGDSFTQGHELEFGKTFAHLLEQDMGVGVANHGVIGFGPLQAALNFDVKRAYYPNLEVVVLGIMNENIRRMVNSFRPAYSRTAGIWFGFKPYVDVSTNPPRIMSNPNGDNPLDIEKYKRLVHTHMETDFWATRKSFPYTVSLVKFLTGPVFRFRQIPNEVRSHKAEFDTPELRRGLKAVAEKFISLAEARRVKPVIVFLPENYADRETPEELIAELEKELGSRAVIGNVGRIDGDWKRYNLDHGKCHPSAYGHQLITAYLAPLLRMSR